MGNGLGHPDTAQAVRDVMKRVAEQVVKQKAPRPRFGRVISVNFEAMTATVWFPGDEAPVSVRMFSSVLPGDWQERHGLGTGSGIASTSTNGYGSVAVVETFQGKQYITQILNGGQFSVDFQSAGSVQIQYGVSGSPDIPVASDYTFFVEWDTFGTNGGSALPNNGGPYAINIGPFSQGQGTSMQPGMFEVDVIGMGAIKSWKFPYNPESQNFTNNDSGDYGDWWRVLPCSSDEVDIGSNTFRRLNSSSTFDTSLNEWKADTGATVTRDSTHDNSGTGWSMKLVNSGSVVTPCAITSTRFKVIPGAQYQLNFDAFSPSAWTHIQPNIDWYNASGTYMNTSTWSDSSIAANTWTGIFSTNYVAPAGADTAVPRIRVGGTPPSSQGFWFDNVSFLTVDSSTRTDIDLDVSFNRTVHGTYQGSGNLNTGFGEMWIRIYMNWINAIQNPNWIVRVKSTNTITNVRSTITSKPVYEYELNPPAPWAYLGYHDANVGYTQSSSSYNSIQDGNWSTGPWRHPDLTLAARAQKVLAGGGSITCDATNFKWSSPFEIAGIGRSRNGLILGSSTITMPTSGAIPIFPSGATVNASSSGIPLASGQSLWFGIPPGVGTTIPNESYFGASIHATGGLFIVDSSSTLWWSPPEWAVLIAYRASDGTVKCGNSQTYDYWRSATVNNGTGTFKVRRFTGNTIQFNANMINLSTISNGTLVATVSGLYIPSVSVDAMVISQSLSGSTQTPHINIVAGTGQVKMYGVGGTAGSASFTGAGFYPVDVA